jgi:tRNA 2-selenouridine synthase
MAIEKLHIEDFLELATQYLVLDVRSPSEYGHAHIPGAYNLALFTNEERKVVGTTYKQTSREAAIKVGLEYFGPKMRSMVEEAEGLVDNRCKTSGEEVAGKKTVLIYCWRGGMRSAAIAWLLDLYGFKVYTLGGGYKKFRNYVLDTFSLQFHFSIIGGYTGSGKTEVLNELFKQGHPAVDLEDLAGHKGSAFGNLGLPPQPSQEMFENKLALDLRKNLHPGEPIWLEDESQRIGTVNIPQAMWVQMRGALVYFLDIPFDERLQHIINWYGKQDREKMMNAIIRIKKRLGGLETKTAVNFLIEENITECFRVLLKYYDKYYLKSLQQRPHFNELLRNLPSEKVNETVNAFIIMSQFQKVMSI